MSIEVKDVYSGYGPIEILHGVSIEAKKGEVTCIIGPNGAGKSTLLKTIFGIIKPTAGTISFANKEITGSRPDKTLRLGISYIPQGRSTFPYLTVMENLEMGAFIENDQQKVHENIEEVFERFPVLRERKTKMAATLSGGEQRMLEFGRALMLHPQAILLDEPSMGLAPKLVDQTWSKIVEMNQAGMTILIVEQNVRKGLSIADHAYILVLGKTAHDGPAAEMLGAYGELIATYLGGQNSKACM
ncbi:MAG: ABC transporter ATP-binding protein [Candidatus Bathyarchaeota archaeon]|nr:MAG: ABC transporter ATP-binding protein [Candidatus Bathyarchaeota archaeon]